MANKVATQSFVIHDSSLGQDRFFRQDITVVTTADAAFVAVPQLFIDSGGAKVATASFCYHDVATGKDFFVRKGKTRLAITHPAYLAAPSLFA